MGRMSRSTGRPAGIAPGADFAYLDALRPSRVRELARGRSSWTSVDVLAGDPEEATAIRAILELMGVHVQVFPLGLAQHAVNLLDGSVGSGEFVVLACHGDEGAIVLPELAPEVAATQRWHTRLPAAAIREFVHLPDRVVIGTGCDMGHPELAQAFLDGGCRAYLAPAGGPFRYASALVPALLFYELAEMRSLSDAVERIRGWDAELAMWRLHERSPAEPTA
jgi:hypothetical protein